MAQCQGRRCRKFGFSNFQVANGATTPLGGDVCRSVPQGGPSPQRAGCPPTAPCLALAWSAEWLLGPGSRQARIAAFGLAAVLLLVFDLVGWVDEQEPPLPMANDGDRCLRSWALDRRGLGHSSCLIKPERILPGRLAVRP